MGPVAATQPRSPLADRALHGANGRAAHDSLFDLTEDPGEASNLAADPAHQDRLEQMVDRMIDARVALEDRTEPRIAKF